MYAIDTSSPRQGIVPALLQRWSSPTAAQNRALGQALWMDLRGAPVADLLPEAAIEPFVAAVVTEPVARELIRQIPRTWLEADLNRLRESGLSVAEILGEEGVDRLRRLVVRPPEVNRELVARMLDQPLLRQALRETLAQGLTQFLSELGESLPFGKSAVGPNGGMTMGVLGELGRGLGRGIARRAADTARIGKTWVEGLGLSKALEDQVQPFVSAWAQRAVSGLIDGLFAGDRAELAAEARLNALDVLLDAELHEVIPSPDLSLIDLRLRALEAVLGHRTTLEGEAEASSALVRAVRASLARGTVGELLDRLQVPAELDDVLVESLGALGHEALSRSHLAAWLAGEVEAAGG